MNDITSLALMENLKSGIIRSGLRELDISYNNIGNDGIKNLA